MSDGTDTEALQSFSFFGLLQDVQELSSGHFPS